MRLVAIALLTLSASVSTLAQHAAHEARPGRLADIVRESTAIYRDVAQATAAGYEAFLGCVSGPEDGAMGVHYVNGTLVGDGRLDATKPEALMYETRNGEPRLIGVEFIVMAADWHAHTPAAPVLAGQTFNYVGSPNRYALPPFYELHVWAWRTNPSGTFADWNPRVSCDR